MAADDEVIEIDEDGNVSRPVKGPIRDGGMTDAERAVREAHTTCFNCVGEVGLRDESEFNIDCHAHHAAIDHAIEAVREETREMMAESLIMAHDDGKRDENEVCSNVGPSIGSAPDGHSTLTWSIGYAAGIDAMRDAIRARIGKEGG